jgi:hypothetical protein
MSNFDHFIPAMQVLMQTDPDAVVNALVKAFSPLPGETVLAPKPQGDKENHK